MKRILIASALVVTSLTACSSDAEEEGTSESPAPEETTTAIDEDVEEAAEKPTEEPSDEPEARAIGSLTPGLDDSFSVQGTIANFYGGGSVLIVVDEDGKLYEVAGGQVLENSTENFAQGFALDADPEALRRDVTYYSPTVEHDDGSFTVYDYVEGEMVATEIPAGDVVMTDMVIVPGGVYAESDGSLRTYAVDQYFGEVHEFPIAGIKGANPDEMLYTGTFQSIKLAHDHPWTTGYVLGDDNQLIPFGPSELTYSQNDGVADGAALLHVNDSPVRENVSDFWTNTVDWYFATPFFTEVGDPNTLHLIDQGDTEYLIPMPDGVSEEDIVEVYGGDRILLMTEDTAYVREDAFDTSEWSEATEITEHLNAGRIKGITIGTTEIYVLLDDGVLYKVN